MITFGGSIFTILQILFPSQMLEIVYLLLRKSTISTITISTNIKVHDFAYFYLNK